jgi:hypothetical protein
MPAAAAGADAGPAAVKRLLLPFLVLVVVAPAAAGGPRDEKERLTKADMAKARHALLRSGDFPAGWSRGAAPPTGSGAERCAGYDPDFSPFTITGKAGSSFQNTFAGAQVTSQVQVFPTAAQARGDFLRGAQPGFLKCLARDLRKSLAAQGLSGAGVRTQPMARVAGVGERALRFRVSVRVAAAGRSLLFRTDFVVLQAGRGIAFVGVAALGKLPLDEVTLARRVASRLA